MYLASEDISFITDFQEISQKLIPIEIEHASRDVVRGNKFHHKELRQLAPRYFPRKGVAGSPILMDFALCAFS